MTTRKPREEPPALPTWARDLFAWRLARRWEPEAIEYVRKALDSADKELLESITPEKYYGAKLAWSPVLQKYLHHSDKRIRERAMLLLAGFFDANAVPAITIMLEDSGDEVRKHALDALKAYGVK